MASVDGPPEWHAPTGRRDDALGARELDRRVEHAVLRVSIASTMPSSTSWLSSGAAPWYRKPPAWMAGGTKLWPSVCILTSGVRPPYRQSRRVGTSGEVGQGLRLDGDDAGIFAQRQLSPTNGKPRPAKLEPAGQRSDHHIGNTPLRRPSA